MRSSLLSVLLLLFGRPAGAVGPDVSHETWRVIGWDDACGVAFEHFYYRKVGEASARNIGTATIPPGQEDSVARLILQDDGHFGANSVASVEADLKKAGYSRRGFPEIIRDAPTGDQPLLAETLLSTATLSARVKKGWPNSDWRWSGGSFNPLGTCALLSYENRAAPRRFSLFLVRVYNPRARRDRSYAHTSNARLLSDAGDLAAAAPEAETAALLDPSLPVARYVHAATLALNGSLDEAASELAAAIELAPEYRAKARKDPDFAELKDRQDFREMTKERPRKN